MLVQGSTVVPVQTDEGVTRKMLGRGGTLMMTEVAFEKGAVGAIHAHPHEQISYVLQGSFHFHLNGSTYTVSKGDSIYIPSDAPHGVTALEDDSIILDIFTPQREDFLKGSTI